MTCDTTRCSIQSVTRSIARGLPGRSLMHKCVSYDVTRTDVAPAGLPEVEIMLKKCWESRHRWSRHTRNHRLATEPVLAREAARLRDRGARRSIPPGGELSRTQRPSGASRPRPKSRSSPAAGAAPRPTLQLRSAFGRTWRWRRDDPRPARRYACHWVEAGIIGEIGRFLPCIVLEQLIMLRRSSPSERRAPPRMSPLAGAHRRGPRSSLLGPRQATR